MLSAYQYFIVYNTVKLLANADALNLFLIPATTFSDCLPGELVQLINHLETNLRRILVMKCVLSGWPSEKLDHECQPYLSRQQELSVMDGCLLWGSRLIIPPPGWKV